MLSATVLSVSGREVFLRSCRMVSSKYPKPKPRHYRRRLFEAAVMPVLPPTVKQCTPPGLFYKAQLEEREKYDDVEIALANLVRNWLRNQEFRVLAVCQFTGVQGRTLWFAKNQLRQKGLEFRQYGNRIMKKVFADTPLRSLEPVLTGNNAILVGKKVEDIRTILQESAKLNWIFPLVLVVDSRIVSIPEAEKIASLPSIDSIRAETVAVLENSLSQLPNSLDSLSHQLPDTLQQLQNMHSPLSTD